MADPDRCAGAGGERRARAVASGSDSPAATRDPAAVSEDPMLDELRDDERRFVEAICAMAKMPIEGWWALTKTLKADVEIIALTR